MVYNGNLKDELFTINDGVIPEGTSNSLSNLEQEGGHAFGFVADTAQSVKHDATFEWNVIPCIMSIHFVGTCRFDFGLETLWL